jgi:hypothetical protein
VKKVLLAVAEGANGTLNHMVKAQIIVPLFFVAVTESFQTEIVFVTPIERAFMVRLSNPSK